jgi:hypothetical protein
VSLINNFAYEKLVRIDKRASLPPELRYNLITLFRMYLLLLSWCPIPRYVHAEFTDERFMPSRMYRAASDISATDCISQPKIASNE